MKMKKLWFRFISKQRGYIKYFAVSLNTLMMSNFIYKPIHIFFKWMNRRSQKKSFNWNKFCLFMIMYSPSKVVARITLY